MKDVKTIYEMFSIQIEKLGLTAIYGTMKYKADTSNKSYKENHIIESLKSFLIYDLFKVHVGYQNLTQVGADLTYSF